MVILLLAFAIRAAAAYVTYPRWFTPDSRAYLGMAEAILAGQPSGYFPNGYPLLIAIVRMWVSADAAPFALMAINVLASTAAVGLVAPLTRRLGGPPRVALAAALLLAVYPHQLAYVRYLLTEPVTELLLIAGVAAACAGRLTLAGSVLALVCLFRSSLVPALPLALLAVALPPWGRHGVTRLAAGMASVLLAYGILIQAGVVERSGNLGTNLRAAVSQRSSGFRFRAIPDATPEQRARPIRAYLAFALNQPAEFVIQRANALWETWGPYPLDTPRSIGENLLVGIRFPLVVLAAIGVIRNRRRVEFRMVAVPIIAITLVHTAFFSAARFAWVLEPLLIATAAATVADAAGIARLGAPACLPASRPAAGRRVRSPAAG
jgi:hypothetical protein